MTDDFDHVTMAKEISGINDSGLHVDMSCLIINLYVIPGVREPSNITAFGRHDEKQQQLANEEIKVKIVLSEVMSTALSN